MVRKISIEEWEKTRENPKRENPEVHSPYVPGEEPKKPRKLWSFSLKIGVFAGMILGAALGYYFYGDFTRWIVAGGFIGAVISVLRSGKLYPKR